MKFDLYALRKARILFVSLPGEWVTVERLSEIYNKQYAKGFMSRMLKKTIMHPVRMERILQRMVIEGFYEYEPGRGFRFQTKTPKKR